MVKAKPARLLPVGIVTLFMKQDKEKNVCVSTLYLRAELNANIDLLSYLTWVIEYIEEKLK